MPHFKEAIKKYCNVCLFNYPKNTAEVVNQLSDLQESEKRNVTTMLEKYASLQLNISSQMIFLTLKDLSLPVQPL